MHEDALWESKPGPLAVDPVGALCALLDGPLHDAEDGDALLLLGVVGGGHPLGVQQAPVRPLVQQQPHQRDVTKPCESFIKYKLCDIVCWEGGRGG